MKRYVRLIILALSLFFISTMTTSAKTMKIDELKKQIEQVQPNAGYAYIIGNYVFTSEFQIKLGDIVLASTSITVDGGRTDPNNITIYQLQRDYDSKFKPTGWHEETPALGTGKIPESLDIRYIDYTHIGEKSSATIGVNIDDQKYTTYKDVLDKALKFQSSDFYDGDLKYENNKVTGLLLKKSVSDISYNEEDKKRFADANYFLAYVLEVPGATSETIIKSNGLDGKTDDVKLSNFDVPVGENDKTPGIVTLVAIDKTKWDSLTKKIVITVDLDGNDDYYDPTEYTIDLSEISFQVDSNEIVSVNTVEKSEEDKKTLAQYGYDSTLNDNVTFTPDVNDPLSIKLGGKLIEQKLNDKVYSKGDEIGYFFDFTFNLAGAKKDKVKIELLKDKDGKTSEKTYQESEYDENGNLTILVRIDPKTVPGANSENSKKYFRVDLDGDEGKEYLPVIYTIDYSGVTFGKSSIFSIDGLIDDNEDKFGVTGWYDDEAGYSVKVEKDESNSKLYHVSGLLPIIEDEDWKEGKPHDFDSTSLLYYLGLKLTLVNGLENFDSSHSSINVVFDHEQNLPSLLSSTDFSNSQVLYLLKALKPSSDADNGAPLKPEDKWFTITVDLDGSDNAEYASYTVKVDYSGLEFQSESSYTSANVVNTVNTDDSSQEGFISSDDQKSYQDWGYDFENVEENLDLTVDNGHYKLTGSIKEQDVEGAKFQSGAHGYYIIVKIYGPTAEQVKDSILEKDNKKWTVRLHDESGDYKDPVKPSEEDYKNGFITVLFKLKDGTDPKEIKYEIDWDGDGDYFLPYEETIDYSGITFLSSHKVIYDDQNEDTENKTDIIWDGETIVVPVEFTATPKDDYHEFAYWNKEDGTLTSEITFANEKDSNTEGKETGDVTLVPHWNLYSDKFIADVLDYINTNSTKFLIEDYDANSGNVTISVIDPETKLSEMNNTSIPGAIAYILLKDEIKSIKLTVSDQSKTFTKTDGTDQDTLKTAVQNGAKELYTTLLSTNFDNKTDDEVAISQLASHDSMKSFTLSLDSDQLAKTVTLLKTPEEAEMALASENSAPMQYTFTFSSDATVVDSAENLKTVLQSNPKEVIIANDISVDGPLEISGNVKINGGGQHRKISTGENTDTIFDIKSGNATIENVKLSGSKTNAVTVEGSANLTISNVEVESDSNLAETFEAGIVVKNGGTLTASNIQFSKETYDIPLVKAEKTGTVINLTDSASNNAEKISDKQEITSSVESGVGDTISSDSDYNYINYYNDANNAKIIKTIFYNYQGGNRLTFVRYNHYNETIKAPENERFKEFNYDGEKYTLLGFTEDSDKILYDGSQETVPEGVTAPEKLVAQEDKHYWASFKLTLIDGIKKVSDETGFKAALNDEDVSAIYITEPIEINLSEEESTINRNISIIGKGSGDNKPIIKAKKISIADKTDNVTFNRIKFEIEAQENQESLIEVAGKKLTIWQSGIKNTGKEVNYALQYKNQESIVDVRWMGLDSPGIDPTNIDKAYIYVEGLAGGSEIYFNTFKVLKENSSSVIIKKFADSAQATPTEENQADVLIDFNTFNTKYSIEILKDATGQSADIELPNRSNDITLGLHYGEEANQDYSKIKLHKVNISKLHQIFIADNGDTTSEIPEGVKAPTPVVELS